MLVQGGLRTTINNNNLSGHPNDAQNPHSRSPRSIGVDRFRDPATETERDEPFQDGSSSNEADDLSDQDTPGPASFFVQAQYSYNSSDTSSLSFAKDDVIEVLTQLPSGWWDGLLGLRRGWFPSNYVRKIEPWEAEAWYDKLAQEVEIEQDDEDELDTGDMLEERDGRDDTLTGTRNQSRPIMEQNPDVGRPIDRYSGSSYVESPLPDDSPTESGIMHEGLDRGSQGSKRSMGRPAAVDSEPLEGQEEETGNPEDFWVPSMTQDGQIYYQNTKTGETAWEIPHIDSADEAEDATFPAPKEPRRPLRVPPRGSSIGGAEDFEDVRAGGEQLEDGAARGVDDGFSPYGLRRRLIEIEEGFKSQFSGGSQSKGKASELLGHVPGGSLDTNGHVGQAVRPGRPGMDRRPSEMSVESANSYGMSTRKNGTNGSGKGKPRKGLGDALKAFGISRNPSLSNGPGQTMPFVGPSSSNQNGASSSGWKMDRFGAVEKAVKRISGTPRSNDFGLGPSSPVQQCTSMQSLQSNGTSRSRHASLRNSQESGPESARRRSLLAWEEEATVRLERAVNDEEAMMDLQKKVEDVTSALDEIISASATYLSVFEAREAAINAGEVEVTRLKEAEALREAVIGLSTPVRRLVHACRHAVLGLPAIVIESLMDDTTQTPTQEHALSFLSIEGLHPSQRRIVASLSKIVFTAHSAVGMDWPVQSCAEKLGKDATDVLGSVELFINEVKALGCLSETGRGVKHIDPLWGFGEVILPRKKDWKRLDERSLKLVEQLVNEMDGQVEKLKGTEAAVVSDLERRAQLEEAVALVERFELTLRNLDVAATLDLDTLASPTSPAESSIADSDLTYSSLVVQAIQHKQAYEDMCSETRATSAQILWSMMQPDAESRSAELLLELQATWGKTGSLLEEMASNATRQAEVVANGQVKGQIGRRSARVLEREKIARRMRSSSRSSSLASMQQFAPRQHRTYDDADNESLRSQDHHSQPFANRSNTSLHARKQSLGRDGLSASSSVSNLSTMADMDNSLIMSARSSTGNFMKGGMGFLRNRSASEVDIRQSPVSGSKKKLAKWLGEEEVSEILDPSQMRPPVEENPSYLAVDYSDDDVILYMEGSVKAGTLQALVERLTLHDRTDHSFNATFLMTYRSFATGVEIVDRLARRYSIQPPAGLTPDQVRDWQTRKQKPVKLRVFNIFKTWLDQYFNEEEDPEVLNKIETFAEEVLARDIQVKMPYQVLLRAVQRRRTVGDIGARRLTVTTAQPPPPIVPKINSSRGVQLLDIDPEELARQLAIFEANLYNRIKPVDCLDTAWSRSNREDGANIKAMILTSNRMAAWVAQAILTHIDAKKRAQVMKYFLQVADHCRRFNNFSTMFAIMAGADSTPINRLKRTKDNLSTKSQALWESLDKTLDIGRKYAGYRELLKRINPPCIPFLGAYLTFLTAIEEGNANMLPCPTDPTRKLIHFAKRQKCADVIREIQQYQATPYTFISLPVVQTFVRERLENVENGPDAYELSLKLEPREREDEKIARMLRESGMI